VINFCANNYLGLSSHPEVIAAAREGLDTHGYGLSSVRFICGTQDLHRRLEARLTEFLGTEDTLLFPSCMDANAGCFEAILGEQDVMIADRLVHASIVDGMRLCKAMRDTYKHSDMGHLREKLEEHQDKRIRMIITDGVFSMDGDWPSWTRSWPWPRNSTPWCSWTTRTPRGSSARPAAAPTSTAGSSARSTSSPRRWARVWAAPRAAASAAGASWSRCAGRRRGPTCSPTPWRR
jgi:hypothetical protein